MQVGGEGNGKVFKLTFDIKRREKPGMS